MNENEPYKVTKSGLVMVGIMALALVAIVFYLLYKAGTPRGDLMALLICSLLGIGLISLAGFLGIKLGRKNYERLKIQFGEIKSFKEIYNYAMLSMI